MQENRAVLHPRQTHNARVLRVVSQLRVNLVRDDDEITLASERGDVFQVRPTHDCTGRVVGKIQHQQLRLRRAFRLKHRARQAETILGFRLHCERHAAGEKNRRAIRDVARLVIQHFLAGVDERTQREIQRLADADGDEHFVVGVVFRAEILGDVFGQRPAQFDVAEVAGVMRRATFKREDGGLADVPGRVEVGLANAQTDHVLHGRDDVEEIADARARDVAHGRVDAVTERH